MTTPTSNNNQKVKQLYKTNFIVQQAGARRKVHPKIGRFVSWSIKRIGTLPTSPTKLSDSAFEISILSVYLKTNDVLLLYDRNKKPFNQNYTICQLMARRLYLLLKQYQIDTYLILYTIDTDLTSKIIVSRNRNNANVTLTE